MHIVNYIRVTIFVASNVNNVFNIVSINFVHDLLKQLTSTNISKELVRRFVQLLLDI